MDKYTRFADACKYGKLKIVKYKMDNDPPTDSDLYNGFTEACYKGHLDIVEYILTKQDPETNYKCLYGALICLNQPKTIEYLFQIGKIDPKDVNTMSTIVYEDGNLAIFKIMVKYAKEYIDKERALRLIKMFLPNQRYRARILAVKEYFLSHV